MIKIKKSPTAEIKPCDWKKVSKKVLLKSTNMHIKDVRKALDAYCKALKVRGKDHDFTKKIWIDWFHKCFKTGFKDKSWWNMHQDRERHHLSEKFENLNLIDVLEYIADCVMAGKARNKEVYPDEKITGEFLRIAFENTFKMLCDQVEVENKNE